jgi:hypothetical protein
MSDVAEGWHPDPDGKPCERYWDGYKWTDQTRPLANPISQTSENPTPIVVKKSGGCGKFALWSLLAFVALVFVACIAGSDGSNSNTTQSSSTQESEPAATANSNESTKPESASVPIQCLDVPEQVLLDIASGEEERAGMIPLRGKAYKSPDYANVYFIAIEFEATGIEKQVGVWARNGIESGLILAADSYAQSFTVWPDADKTDAQILPSDPAIKIARECLN